MGSYGEKNIEGANGSKLKFARMGLTSSIIFQPDSVSEANNREFPAILFASARHIISLSYVNTVIQNQLYCSTLVSNKSSRLPFSLLLHSQREFLTPDLMQSGIQDRCFVWILTSSCSPGYDNKRHTATRPLIGD